MGNNKTRKRIRPTAIHELFRYFAPHLRPYRKTLFLAALCMLGVTFMELLRPWPMKLIFDVILIPQDNEMPDMLNRLNWLTAYPGLLVATIALSILFIASLSGLFSYGQATLTASVGQNVIGSIRRQLYHHIQQLSHSFHDQSRTGDLLARLTGDIRLMRELLVTAVLYLGDRALVLICMIGIMLWMDWQLTLVAIAIIPVLAITLIRYLRRIKGAAKTQRQRESEITNVMTEKLSAIKLVQIFAREAHENDYFSRHNTNSVEASLSATRLEAHLSRLVQIIIAVGISVVVWFGVYRVQSGVLTAGDLLVFAAYLKGTYKPIRKLSTLITRIAKATVSGERIAAILETEPEIKDSPHAITAPVFRGEIVLRKVDFEYKTGKPVLTQANLRITAGEAVAIMGESGSGKSTIASLILRLYDPQQGQVLIDDRNVKDYTLLSLREQIALVPQNAILFSTTVAENIAYGKLDATREEIIAAASAANAHDFIQAMPDGYDTVVGERGDTLSGGQRQRIAIARAMIRKAAIVILDEPTTGLDTDNRAEVDAALTRLTANTTCITITHDLCTAKTAQRILLMKGGKLADISAQIRDTESESGSGVILPFKPVPRFV